MMVRTRISHTEFFVGLVSVFEKEIKFNEEREEQRD